MVLRRTQDVSSSGLLPHQSCGMAKASSIHIKSYYYVRAHVGPWGSCLNTSHQKKERIQFQAASSEAGILTAPGSQMTCTKSKQGSPNPPNPPNVAPPNLEVGAPGEPLTPKGRSTQASQDALCAAPQETRRTIQPELQTLSSTRHDSPPSTPPHMTRTPSTTPNVATTAAPTILPMSPPWRPMVALLTLTTGTCHPQCVSVASLVRHE